jgi:hypothetical protein
MEEVDAHYSSYLGLLDIESMFTAFEQSLGLQPSVKIFALKDVDSPPCVQRNLSTSQCLCGSLPWPN